MLAELFTSLLNPTPALLLALAGLLGLQLLLTIYMGVSLYIASRERAAMNREIFGMLRKIEGLTSHRREQVLRHYDKMLESLSHRLPPLVASQTSQMIYDTESRILTRLAELEPDLRADPKGQEKMNSLIASMENLEHTIVTLTADTVKRVMVEGRRSLIDEDTFNDVADAH